MKLVALDISTSSGFSVLEGEIGFFPAILDKGVRKNPISVLGYGKYPENYLLAASNIAEELLKVVVQNESDIIVIEETNRNSCSSRYSQKILEFCHCILIFKLQQCGLLDKVKYINTSHWRKQLGITLTKEDKESNKKVKQIKDKKKLKELGIRGKITQKHLAIRYVNQNFGLDLMVKDDDIADAICLGTSYFFEVPICNGK